ncbi:phosphoribosyl-AMP cyclohydrolase [Methanothermus fervidus DSM 2088]|uniref:Phosphoribosyl-AMP cyclohydrolase n=1 Tax=Methanothermus fervidus (strain ATCC 43054 / DSM 2088 / JCM 10308 / V24 S) TaxID=523846 RepID=E3GWQ7_METFV|nr:phosphoribosyl-AMP cyclohydrolase [Methanothermus fervidus DSM 2088]
MNFRHEINGEKLVIAIAQDFKTNKVLMTAYMNKEAFEKTLKTKKAHYWSTSRKKVWMKGETSGNIQKVREMYVDCDRDAVLLKVEQKGGACHTGHYSCFYRKIDMNNMKMKSVEKQLFDPKEVYGGTKNENSA